jgi:signal transduction histidine kinase
VEDVDPAAGTGRGELNPATSTLGTELLARVREDARRARETAHLPGDLRRRLDDCDARARRRADDFRQGAALDFLGDAVAAIAVDDGFAAGEARAAVAATADEIGLPRETVTFAVFRRALASRECVQLPPALAADLILSLLVELAPAAASSLWTVDEGGATLCVAASGKAPRSRRLRAVARGALDGILDSPAHVRVQLVERWDRPYAALVARTTDSDAGVIDDYLAEAAAALAPMLERTALFERGAERERELVAAGERRLVRVGCDLHDGPLQEIVALADELRLVRSQVEEVVRDEDRFHVRGRFLDLEARLEALDAGLRRIAHSVRSSTALTQPVEDAVRRELDALGGATSIETELVLEGDVGELTDSQKIVIFRVVQEALSNVRKHSRASRVSVEIRSTRTFLDVSVTDDGCGFDRTRKADPDRLGLAGVSERVRLLGGTVEIESHPGEGTTVRATLPQWRPSSEAIRSGIYAVGS